MDVYTKCVLTVIAACLVWDVATGDAVVERAWAQTGGAIHVIIDDVHPQAFLGPLDGTLSSGGRAIVPVSVIP